MNKNDIVVLEGSYSQYVCHMNKVNLKRWLEDEIEIF